jgi:hypothetical protein
MPGGYSKVESKKLRLNLLLLLLKTGRLQNGYLTIFYYNIVEIIVEILNLFSYFL